MPHGTKPLSSSWRRGHFVAAVQGVACSRCSPSAVSEGLVDGTYNTSALLAAVRDKSALGCCDLRLDHRNKSLLFAGGYKEVFAVTWFGCVLLCAQIVFAQAVSQTHHRHHLEVLQGQSVEPDTGCGYTGSKVIFTALYGTTVRTPWLNCAAESAMLKRGNDSVIVLTDNIEQFKESWPGSLPSPARPKLSYQYAFATLAGVARAGSCSISTTEHCKCLAPGSNLQEWRSLLRSGMP